MAVIIVVLQGEDPQGLLGSGSTPAEKVAWWEPPRSIFDECRVALDCPERPNCCSRGLSSSVRSRRHLYCSWKPAAVAAGTPGLGAKVQVSEGGVPSGASVRGVAWRAWPGAWLACSPLSYLLNPCPSLLRGHSPAALADSQGLLSGWLTRPSSSHLHPHPSPSSPHHRWPACPHFLPPR